MCTALDQSVVLVGLLIGEKPVCFSRSEKEERGRRSSSWHWKRSACFKCRRQELQLKGELTTEQIVALSELEEMSEVER